MVVVSRSGARIAQIMTIITKFIGVRFAAKLSLVTIVGTDENQAGTMFHITFDISLLLVYDQAIDDLLQRFGWHCVAR